MVLGITRVELEFEIAMPTWRSAKLARDGIATFDRGFAPAVILVEKGDILIDLVW